MSLSVSREHVLWHDLECGSYSADLPLWRELAERSGGAVLDIGAGTGRVSLELARVGHRVTALDIDAVLLGALAERAGALDLETVCADARAFALRRRDYALCIVPMQTIQLLGDSAARVRALACARAHLREGGLVACAILSALEPFDCVAGEPGPPPERRRINGALYMSRPLRVAEEHRQVVIERERRVLAAPALARPPQRDLVRLACVSVAELQRDGIAAGLYAERPRRVAATAEHAGSEVVMLRG